MLAEQLQQQRQHIDGYLNQLLQQRPAVNSRLQQAMHHALLLGGKRVRPFLVYQTAALFDVASSRLDAIAGALECIHAFSLVHDDLPAMDNDALRRGQPTCHIAFDEATAILAGDSLQALAFELITTSDFSAAQQIAMVKVLAQATGDLGMCAGQAMDLQAEDRHISLSELELLHRHKTGALLSAAVELGLIAAGQQHGDTADALRNYAQAIGLAFQVQDDILDVISDTATLGKTQGADIERHKSTYPALLGLSGAQDKAEQLTVQALQALTQLPYNTQTLAAFARYITERRF